MVELPLLREQYQWPAPIGDLRVLARASQLRVWHWENRHQGGLQIPAALRRIKDTQAATGYIPDDVPHFLWWHTPLHRHLQDTLDSLASKGVTLRSITTAMFPQGLREDRHIRLLRKGTQRTAVGLQVRAAGRLHGDARLRCRLERILPAGNFPRRIQCLRRQMSEDGRHMPMRVRAAVLRTIHNGWCTDRRLRQAHRRRNCWLCGLGEGDDMAHYALCPTAPRLWQFMSPGATPPQSFLELWIGSTPLPRFTHRLAMLHCYAVYRTVHALRRHTGPMIQDTGRSLRQAVYAGIRGNALWRRHFGLSPTGKRANLVPGGKPRKRRKNTH
jgi:hypothetical protein